MQKSKRILFALKKSERPLSACAASTTHPRAIVVIISNDPANVLAAAPKKINFHVPPQDHIMNLQSSWGGGRHTIFFVVNLI